MLKKILFIIVFVFSLLLFSRSTQAGTLAESYIRLDRTKAETKTSGLICVQPQTNATEANVSIQFPSSFTVSSTLANWNVSTADIPSGTEAWPGIQTATSVNGQTVTFPSNNLSTGTVYCFRFINEDALTTGSVGQTTSVISTKTNSGAVIDTKNIKLSIQSTDQITVVGTIPAKSTDGEISIASSPSAGSTMNADETITVTLSYRSKLSSNQPFEMVASWDKGKIGGSSTNLTDIFHYVISSSEKAEGSISPVIDLTERTITWSIPSLTPSTTLHSVSFQLQTRSDIPTTLTSSIIHANGTLMNTVLPESTETIYAQKTYITPTPTATPIPQPTSTGAPVTSTLQPTVTPTPSLSKLLFSTIEITDILSDRFTVRFSANRPVKYQLNVGLSKHELKKYSKKDSYKSTHTVKIQKLIAGTPYYFTITIIDRYGNKITSDIFIANTAIKTDTNIIDIPSSYLLWKNVLIATAANNKVIIPTQKPIVMIVPVSNPKMIQSIIAQFKNTKVLGLNNIKKLPPEREVQLHEILSHSFSGELLTPRQKGSYTLTLHIKDIYGGYYQKNLPFSIIISDPLIVLSEHGVPVENAHVRIFHYSPHTKLFNSLEKSLSLETYTDENGALDIVLPIGLYRIEIMAYGFKPLTKIMKLGENNKISLPIRMKTGSSILDKIQYFQKSGEDMLSFLERAQRNVYFSIRARDVLFIGEVGLILILVLSSIALRLHTGLLQLPIVILLSLVSFIKRKLFRIHNTYIVRLIESNNYHKYINRAFIIFVDSKGKSLLKIHTNIAGVAEFPASVFKNMYPITIHAFHVHYYCYPITINNETEMPEIMEIAMMRYVPSASSLMGFINWFYEMFFIIISDILTFASLLISFFFVYYKGVIIALPFIILSFFCVIFWLLYVKRIWEYQRNKNSSI